uniref:Uncharacterized protein n=1 Tax=Rhizophagus irregularis (strain DAOM 181602 / DAOM 197198 / MUCL 43194) TaxID=747089 RepID=U9UC77_RHIID
MVKIKIKGANIVPGASRCGNIVTTLISFALCYTELCFGITRQISVKLRIQQSSCLVNFREVLRKYFLISPDGESEPIATTTYFLSGNSCELMDFIVFFKSSSGLVIRSYIFEL